MRQIHVNFSVTAVIAITAVSLLSGCEVEPSQSQVGLAGEPYHLRLMWLEDPAREATVSWSTVTEGTEHTVYYDVVPRGADTALYANSVTEHVTGEYVTGEGPFFHHVKLDGLEPSTKYYLTMVSQGIASAEYWFETAPVDDRPFKLLYGGDSRSDPENRTKMNERIRDLVEGDPSILALWHGGDYIATGDDWSQWDRWLQDHEHAFTADRRLLPIIPARGNHEGDGVLYNRVFGDPGGPAGDYWATQMGSETTLLTLDSNVSLGGDQKVWLEDRLLEAQEGKWIVPNYHRPAYPAVKTPGGALTHWVPLFEQYDVDFVFESDGHTLKRTVPIRNDRMDPTGIVYLGEGGLGVAQRTPDTDRWYLQEPGMATSAHHVQLIDVTPQKIEYRAIAMDGTDIDTYEFEPRRAGRAAPPVILEANLVAADAVELVFSEELDAATAVDFAGYRWEPELEIRQLTYDDGRHTVVLETAVLEPDTTYRLEVSGVTDLAGQEISATMFDFRYDGQGEMPQPGDDVTPEPEEEEPVDDGSDSASPGLDEGPDVVSPSSVDGRGDVSCSSVEAGTSSFCGMLFLLIGLLWRRRRA